jgi:hypothetical protein
MDMDMDRETTIRFINKEKDDDGEEQREYDDGEPLLTKTLHTKNRDYIPNTTNTTIDKLTLEIMGNKTKYKKYLSKTDPDKYQEIQEYTMKLKQYETDISLIINDYIHSPNKQITTDLDEAFEHFAKSCIKYLEMKEFENNDYKSNDKTEDVLFPYTNRIDKQSFHSSYWGKSITKVYPSTK